MLQNELPNKFEIVSPNAIDQLTGKHQACPTGHSVAARQNQLRIGKSGIERGDLPRMEFFEILKRRRILASHLAKQIFRLLSKLVEIGANGEMAVRHDKPPSE